MTTLDRKALYEQIAARYEAEDREQRTIVRRDMVRTALEVAAWCAFGLFLLGVSFYVNSYDTGIIYFWSGLIVGYAGMWGSLLAAYRRGEERGDW